MGKNSLYVKRQLIANGRIHYTNLHVSDVSVLNRESHVNLRPPRDLNLSNSKIGNLEFERFIESINLPLNLFKV